MNITQHLIQNLDGIERGSEITFLCPNPEHNDTKPSASYNPDKDVWHCFSCGAKGRGDSIMNSTKVSNKSNVTILNKSLDTNLVPTYASNLLAQSGQTALSYLVNTRGLNLEAIKKFNLGYDPDAQAITIPVYVNGVCTNVVRRYMSGNLRYKGLPGVSSRLFCTDMARDLGGNQIAITEGELDAVSSYVLSGYKLPTISTGGVRNTPSDLVSFLKEYSKIYIVFDADKPGTEGAESLATLLGKERCYRVELDKDLNDLLVQDTNAADIYRQALKAARPYGEPRLCEWGTALDQAVKFLTEGYQTGISTGHPNLDALFGGLRKGTLTVLTAKPGVGKTTLASSIAYNVACKANVKTLVCSFEQHFAYSTALQILSFHLGRNVELQKEFLPEDIQTLRDTDQVLGNINWLNHNGLYDIDRLETDIRTAYRDGVRFVILDHLQILVDSTDTSQVEKIMNMFVRLKDSLKDIMLLLLVQPKRLQDEQRSLTMRDLKGGAAIEASADTILAIDDNSDGRFIATLKVRSTTVLVPVGSYCSINFNKQTYYYSIDNHRQAHTEDKGYL